jgi:thiol-disulfide isomerase/thioredoxin
MKERRFFFIILPALLILADSRQASAQQSISQQQDLDVHVRNLRIGDNVPDFHISKIINNDKPNAKISDFRNQLLILDFWDTYCPSCIQALPVLDSMQRLFGKQIRILPVTYQKEALMRNFFKKNPIAKNLTLPCIVEDKILSSAFRHWYISHEVWIYKGVVKAITYTEFINPINIRQVLNNEKLDWPVKNDIVDFDYDKQSLFKLESSTGQNYTLGGRKMYSVISGYQSGLKGLINTVIDTFNKTVRTYWVNKDILTSYYIAYREVGFNGLSTKSTGRLILEVKDSAKYFYRPEYGLNAVWDAKNMYCYESVLPMSVSKRERYQIAIAEMDAFWGLKSGWEKSFRASF